MLSRYTVRYLLLLCDCTFSVPGQFLIVSLCLSVQLADQSQRAVFSHGTSWSRIRFKAETFRQIICCKFSHRPRACWLMIVPPGVCWLLVVLPAVCCIADSYYSIWLLQNGVSEAWCSGAFSDRMFAESDGRALVALTFWSTNKKDLLLMRILGSLCICETTLSIYWLQHGIDMCL